MAKTALQLVTAACRGAGLPVPSQLVGSSDAYELQLLELFYDTGRELRNSRCWSLLKKRYEFALEEGRTQYQLPQDFYAILPQTQWDVGNNWEALGPLSDGQYNYRNYGWVTVENRKSFRFFGPANFSDSRGQFYVSPTPTDSSATERISIEYVSRAWLRPPDWAASTALTGSIYRYANNNIYLLTTNGTTSAVSPSLSYGIGQDGGVFWRYVAASSWGGSTAYAVGQYVTNGGNYYRCIQSGTSASSGGPTGTDSSEITDGGCKWVYKSSAAWAAYTEYSVGDHVTNGGNLYEAMKGPFYAGTKKSGATGPRWTATVETDGTAGWTHYTGVYDELQTDSDLVLFDDELMILGLRWRYMAAKGLSFDETRYDYEMLKSSSADRWHEGKVYSHCGESETLAGLNPNIPDGDYGG